MLGMRYGEDKMELKDTIDLMLSDDYKDRFRAEYWQTRIRSRKLREMIDKFYEGKLDFKPSCPIEILEEQLQMMYTYMKWLNVRAKIEGIDLKES